jgi:hypothetical protein
MFRLDDPVDYDIRPNASLSAIAVRVGTDATGLVYDTLIEAGGHRLLYLPLFNFVERNLGAVRSKATVRCLDSPTAGRTVAQSATPASPPAISRSGPETVPTGSRSNRW